jgi:hypothetical protein
MRTACFRKNVLNVRDFEPWSACMSTSLERRAIRRALQTADFGRSPGLRERMKRSLRRPPEWGLIACIVTSVALWLTFMWAVFHN